MFAVTENKGFQVTFSNGYTISCQFGATNYCANYGRHLDPDYQYLEEMRKRIHTCESCEVAIWKKGVKKWVTTEIIEAMGMEPCFDEDVLANVTPEEVAKIMAYLATLEV